MTSPPTAAAARAAPDFFRRPCLSGESDGLKAHKAMKPLPSLPLPGCDNGAKKAACFPKAAELVGQKEPQTHIPDSGRRCRGTAKPFCTLLGDPVVTFMF